MSSYMACCSSAGEIEDSSKSHADIGLSDKEATFHFPFLLFCQQKCCKQALQLFVVFRKLSENMCKISV